MELKNKKILLVGLGILGGGEAIARFIVKNGARLTITDIRNKKILSSVINRLKNKKIKFVLGKHRKIDFKNNEIIVFNPAVSIFSTWVKLAKKYGRHIENDLTFFLKMSNTECLTKKYITVTGTRGKTTVATWINYFLENSVLGGNMPNKGLLGILRKKTRLFILELSSFQLEFMRKGLQAPKIAVITNFYNDHLNRYGDMAKYLDQKAKIFLNQTKNDFLILNADNKYTKEFLKKKPKSRIYYFSLKKLPKNKNGLFFNKNKIYFQENARISAITDKCAFSDWAEHQKANLLASLLGAYLSGQNWKKLIRKIKILPSIPFRQEVVLQNKNLTIINDTVATSPDATIAGLERFARFKKSLILITGGTDKNLDFNELANKIKKYIKENNLFLLEGSATIKLIKELNRIGYFQGGTILAYQSLQEILKSIKGQERKSATILFSPAAASFEKFKNEFDRGKKFNNLVKNIFLNNLCAF